MKKETSTKEKKTEAAPQVLVALHALKPAKGSHKHRKLRGRGPGSGHGKTSTRGSKGQTSRSGRGVYAGFEGGQSPLIRRMPKRGFRNKFPTEYQVINVGALAKITETPVTPEVLYRSGLIASRNKRVKILGDGELTKALVVHSHAFSKSAEEKIKKAGGTAEVLNA